MGTWVIILIIVGSILVLTFSMMGQASPPFDPFLPYTDLLTKNQTRDAMMNWNFSCQFVLSEGQQSCSLRPDDNIFSTIYVTIAQGVPLHMTFEVEKDTLQLGDLVLLWGKPGNRGRFQRSVLSWPDISVTVFAVDNMEYFAPVQVVTFTFS